MCTNCELHQTYLSLYLILVLILEIFNLSIPLQDRLTAVTAFESEDSNQSIVEMLEQR
jgi:hypothetical protein